MTKEIVDVVIILDQSGSMEELTKDTIGGFNSLIKKQKKDNEGAKVYITTILFNDNIKLLHNALPVEEIPQMTDKDYIPSGSTALYDAIGVAIEHEDERVLKLSRLGKKVPQKTLIVITTDGYENASINYSYEKIRKLIETRKDQGVSFMFIGADIDSDDFASKLSIDKDLTFNTEKSSRGINMMMACMSLGINKCKKIDTTNLGLKKK